jgi:hypothetical protein
MLAVPFVRFHDYFPALAEAETRSIRILNDANTWCLPPDDYGFMELFCDEPGCDCRRVFFLVVSPRGPKPMAVIAYGWEKLRFYKHWLRHVGPEQARDLKGPVLNDGSPQSKLAPSLLLMTEDVLLRNRDYMERVKRHYRMMRDVVDGGQL